MVDWSWEIQRAIAVFVVFGLPLASPFALALLVSEGIKAVRRRRFTRSSLVALVTAGAVVVATAALIVARVQPDAIDELAEPQRSPARQAMESSCRGWTFNQVERVSLYPANQGRDFYQVHFECGTGLPGLARICGVVARIDGSWRDPGEGSGSPERQCR